MTTPARSLFQVLFQPRSIALIGASGDAAKNTARPQRFLRKHGYGGKILPINPARGEVLGLTAYRSVAAAARAVVDTEAMVNSAPVNEAAASAAAPASIDQAFIMVPTERVLDAVRDCAAAGVRVATIFSDGFAELGEAGAGRQRELVEAAGTMRILGPNCIGLVSAQDQLALTVNATLEMDSLHAGGLSIVSQSGSMMGALLSRAMARGLGVAKLVSVGNESDIGVGELVALLADDPHTRVIALFLESLRDAPALAQAARLAFSNGKAVIAYKLGRSALGEALALSHTGALAGSDAAARAFFAHHGIVRVISLEALIEIAPLVDAHRPHHGLDPIAGTPRVAVVTTTGGGAATVADQLGVLGLQVATPDDALVAALASGGVTIRNTPIIDLTLAATPRSYGAVLAALAQWPGCDAVLAVVGSSAQFHPELAVQPIVSARANWCAPNKPLCAFLAPDAPASLRYLAACGVAAFRTPESCAESLAAALCWKAPRGAALGAPVIVGPAIGVLRERYDEAAALQLFAELGIATAATRVARAPTYVHDLPYPVAVKIASTDITHKSDVGGVVLDVRDSATLISAAEAMRHAHLDGGHFSGVTVQTMQRGLGEAIVGYRHDAQVGPIVIVGAGGVFAEAQADVAVAIAPINLTDARALIARVRGFAALRGLRGRPAGDLESLAQAVVAMSRLALVPEQPFAEAEANPIIVSATGAIAVDGVVIRRSHSKIEPLT